MKLLKQYHIWDIPSVILKTFKVILKKYPNKPITVIVWETKTEIDKGIDEDIGDNS